VSEPVITTPDIPRSPICSEDRMAGKFIALPQEISADPWQQGNAGGRQRPRCEVGREVGLSRSSEEAGESPWSEGDNEDENNETRTTELGVCRQPARGPSRGSSQSIGNGQGTAA